MLSKGVRRLFVFTIIINLIAIFIISIGGYLYLKNESVVAQVVEVDMAEKAPELIPVGFVDVKKHIPDIEVQLMYASENNIVGKKLYSDDSAYLRKATADKLARANEEFKKLGYRMKIWDAYRPTEVQYTLWQKVPDSRYIVEPKKGSVHSRGAAVDITLVDRNGKEISMPTGFDGFNKKADKNYSDVSAEKAKNAKLLEKVMVENGFESVYYEWWHFNDKDWKSYALVDKITWEAAEKKDESMEISVSKGEEKPSMNSAEVFMGKVWEGLSSIDLKKIKVQMQYELSKVKDIFNEYNRDV
jgi:D-alanyl-D-alanine dipeptidase